MHLFLTIVSFIYCILISQPTSKSSQLGTPKLKPTKRSVLPDIDEFNFTKRSSTTIRYVNTPFS